MSLPTPKDVARKHPTGRMVYRITSVAGTKIDYRTIPPMVPIQAIEQLIATGIGTFGNEAFRIERVWL